MFFFIALTLSVLHAGLLLAAPLPAAASPMPARWTDLRRDELQVATVMYRLATANRQMCRDALAPQSGFAVHGVEQYGAADRSEAAGGFGLDRYVGVIGVVADSPAARAGLSANDQIIAVNGRDLPAALPASATPTNARVETARNLLLIEMAKGEVVLLVAGAQGRRTVRFTAEQGCSSAIELVLDAVVNASADGRRVMISEGLLARCTTESDLALVIAHELAHNLLHHADRLARAGISTSNGFLHATASGTAEMRKTEEEADRLGVRLAVAAGYDLSGAASFLSDLQVRDNGDPALSTHPAPARRLTLLRAAIAGARRGSRS
jgi:hypothetical protein